MSLVALKSLLDAVLSGGKVRRKVNNTKDLFSKASRVARGCPEVMVKITGFGKGARHIAAHLNYITRNAKLRLETDRGDIVSDKKAVAELSEQWSEDLNNRRRHKNQRDMLHLVLSMPEGTPETAVQDAARVYAKQTFGANHEYVFALHTDERHPHVHLTVKMVGFNGRRLNPRKADLQAWRETFAREMRNQGIEAEATPRSARGVVRKAERSVVRHIEQEEGQRPLRRSRTKAARMQAAAEELIAESSSRSRVERPWEAHIKQRQQKVRRTWLAAATALETGFSSKEQINAQPEYDKLDSGRVRAGQRAAAVYQPNLERLGLRAPAVALARMRDMSRLDVVQHQRSAQVLLHADAFDGVGRNGRADHDLRWSRARTFAVATGARDDGERPTRTSGVTSGRTLANAIHAFVGRMPPIETERDELKRRLIDKFSARHESTLQTEKTLEQTLVVPPPAPTR